ncbi:MAG TPA: NAD-dependent epimerase/dehydratase family protein [Bryobacteraceae bacterium]|nr:NAD-dependent epimerase/dehydratase family protein [Bryobacteraceae bacterium]
MKILITGICGFVGSRVATALLEQASDLEIAGIDNLLRPGSELNRAELTHRGVRVIHGDLRMRSDVDALPDSDWVIDAAANPSVLAGVDGRSSPRQLSEHNLGGTINLLEYCRERKAGLILLSTNRVYSVRALAELPVVERGRTFELDASAHLPNGVSADGIAEEFSVQQPISLYGATKLASEVMALEYSATFNFPLWINRCGVLAGAGQFGTAEQGIFSYWLHAHAAKRPLRYIGFGGHGLQVRDAFHPDDLAELILTQIRRAPQADAIFHAGGGRENAMSLAQLTAWANDRFGKHEPTPDLRPRPFDAPWIVMNCSRAVRELGWVRTRGIDFILNEIAEHVTAHPDWLLRCGVV